MGWGTLGSAKTRKSIMTRRQKRQWEYWSGVLWSVAFLLAVIWLGFQEEKTPYLQPQEIPQYSLEQFIE
jgi:hypothetical protein